MLKRAVTMIAAFALLLVAAAHLSVPALAGDVSFQITTAKLEAARVDRTRAALVRIARKARFEEQASAYAALPREEREHLQRMLMWTGDYRGAVDGAIGTASLDAIRAFRSRHPRMAAAGTMSPAELQLLGREADSAFETADFTLGTDTDAGVSFGMPYALVKWQEKTESGNLYADAESRFRVTSFRIEGVDSTNVDGFAASVFEDVPGYASETRTVRSDFIEVRGGDRYENLLLRAVRRGDEIRGLFVWWDKAVSDTHGRYIAAMISSLAWDDGEGDTPPVASLPSGRDDPRAPKESFAPRADAKPELAGLRAPDGSASRAGIDLPEGHRMPDEEPESFGSAFAVREDGFLVTNAHVIRECGRVVVKGYGKAHVRSTDDELDLAVLSIPGAKGMKAAPIADDDAVLAEDVFAFGFPLPNTLGEELGFSRGSVSAEVGLRAERRQFRMTAAVQPGNSGGPLLDNEGRVVGIVTSKLNAMRIAQETGDIPQGMNFAVKASTLRDYLKSSSLLVPVVARKQRPLLTPLIARDARHFTYQVLCFRK